MLGDQNMLQRFASAKNSDEAKKSNIGMFIGEILVIIRIVLVVTQAAKLYPTLDVPSNVIFQVAVDYLPLSFGALVMCAFMAFIVTTADSYLLSSATNLTNDIYVNAVSYTHLDVYKRQALESTEWPYFSFVRSNVYPSGKGFQRFTSRICQSSGVTAPDWGAGFSSTGGRASGSCSEESG